MVTQVIDRLGGIPITAGTAGISVESVYEARRRGYLLEARACVRRARVLEPKDPARQLALVKQLAGLPD